MVQDKAFNSVLTEILLVAIARKAQLCLCQIYSLHPSMESPETQRPFTSKQAQWNQRVKGLPPWEHLLLGMFSSRRLGSQTTSFQIMLLGDAPAPATVLQQPATHFVKNVIGPRACVHVCR